MNIESWVYNNLQDNLGLSDLECNSSLYSEKLLRQSWLGETKLHMISDVFNRVEMFSSMYVYRIGFLGDLDGS